VQPLQASGTRSSACFTPFIRFWGYSANQPRSWRLPGPGGACRNALQPSSRFEQPCEYALDLSCLSGDPTTTGTPTVNTSTASNGAHSGATPPTGADDGRHVLAETRVDAPPMERDALLTASEVGAILSVNPKTVARWAKSGQISAFRTPGGHRRYDQSEVLALLPDGARFQSRAEHASSSSAAPAPHREQPGAPELTAAALNRAAGAAAAVATTAALDAQAQADQAAAAVVSTADAVRAAAERAAEAARRTREATALAAVVAAEAIAGNAAKAAETLQLRADALAVRLSTTASRAASTVAAAVQPGHEREAAAVALTLAAKVRAAAADTARDTSAAAARVANAVSAAAADVASAVAAAAIDFENEVAEVAATLQATATATARRVAADTEARARDADLVSREAAIAAGMLADLWAEATPTDATSALDSARTPAQGATAPF
jgi:excisionase family DNA binding protein